MITFISATPGAGKTLSLVEIFHKLSKDNQKNLKHNFLLYKAFLDKVIELNLLNELSYVERTTGQGLEKKTELILLDSDYFDFLLVEYNLNIVLNEYYKELENNYPDYYFERIIDLNAIVDRINDQHKIKLQQFKFVRPFYTNINGLLLSQARSLPENADWRLTPYGSVIGYDEAQLIEVFSDETKKIDPILRDLTIHRHRSYDIYFISQDPALVHKYVRKLCGHHIHLINAFGFEQSIRVEWSICQDQPNAIRNIGRAESSKLYRFPKVLYKVYKSTTASTRVKRYPWKKFIIIGCLASVGIYGASGLFSGNNALVSFATGGKYGNEPIKPKQDDKTTTDRLKDSPMQDRKTEVNQETKPDDQVASASDPAVSSDNPTQYSVQYDITKPYDYEPPNTMPVVNHRVFSGCFCNSKGFCKAYDQQGIRINGISQSTCKEILKDPSSRPFDYFNNKSNRTENLSTATNVATENIQPNYNQDQAVNQVQPHLQRPMNGSNQL